MRPENVPAHAGMTNLVPDRIVGGGRYRLMTQLGRGGMGVVWMAKDLRLGENVALKFLPPEIGNDPVALDDLRRETIKSHRLTHPNIIRIHDFHEAPGEAPFISMEYVDGENLSAMRLTRPNRVFTWDCLAPLVRQLCDALDYAHGEKVVHRDLKPGNLMLDSRDRLKLADFGIAATISDSVSRSSLRSLSSGTVTHMSPQQMDGETPRPTDDIYALGATLYELLTSRPPFYSGDIPSQVRNLPAKPIDERLAELKIKSEIPPAVSAMVMACLAKEPAQRPPNARAVAERAGLTLDSRTAHRADSRAFPRRKLVLVAGFVVALLLGAGAWHFGVHRGNERSSTAPVASSANATPPELTVKRDLLAYLPLTGDFADQSGRSLPVKIQGSVVINGGAAEFDGGQSWLELPHIELDARPFAISLALKLSATARGFGLIEQNGGERNRHLTVALRDDLQLFFGFYLNDLRTKSTVTPADGWVHLVFQFDQQKKAIHLNGRRIAEHESPAFEGTSGVMFIGRSPGWDKVAIQNLNGSLRHLRFYSRALTDGEIAWLATADRKPPPAARAP